MCFSYPSETKSPRLWQRAGNHFFTLLKKAQGCGSVLATIFYPVLKNVQGRGKVVATIFRPLLQMSKAVTGWWQPFFTLLMKKSKAVRVGRPDPGFAGWAGLRLSQPGPESPDPGRPGWAAFLVVFTWESEEKIPFFLSICLRFMFVL